MLLAYIKIKLRNYVKGKLMDYTFFFFSIQQFQRKWKNKRNKLHITFFSFALRSKRKEERLDEL
jgi:hypothetical protein